ncbi:hypothetical protein CFIICLFH_3827 [Methylobacterium goesingense]|nr:hypothetical protein CFIICLFH_3827 [Methylobacterium goesingense]
MTVTVPAPLPLAEMPVPAVIDAALETVTAPAPIAVMPVPVSAAPPPRIPWLPTETAPCAFDETAMTPLLKLPPAALIVPELVSDTPPAPLLRASMPVPPVTLAACWMASALVTETSPPALIATIPSRSCAAWILPPLVSRVSVPVPALIATTPCPGWLPVEGMRA